MDKKRYKVSGMSCAACVARVEKAVSALEGVEGCEVNLLLGTMDVVGDASSDEIALAVKRAGYSARPEGINNESKGESGSSSNIDDLEKNRTAIRLVFSLALLLVLMYISMGHMMLSLPLPAFMANNPIAIALSEMILSAIVMIINKRFFINGAKGIIKLSPNMDTLVALGSFVSFVYSVVIVYLMSSDLVSGDVALAHSRLHGLYFESAAMILVLITVGKLLEAHAKGKTTSAIKSLMDLTPKMVTVIRDGEETVIPVKEIKVGDVFIAKRGENLAVDGKVIFGEISVDESALTGESIPVDKTVGASVFGATTVLSGYAKIEAVKVGEQTAIAAVIKMVKEASGSKAPVAKAADKVAGVFVPFVILVSVITLITWLFLRVDVGVALERAVTVLVISCPCALGLATPVAIMVGSGVGAKHGILFKTAAGLEAAGKIKTVAFDKTGTITEGKPEVKDVISSAGVDSGELLKLAISLEERSEHPLARAIVAEKNNLHSLEYPVCEEFLAQLGGVSGIVGGNRIFGGNRAFVQREASTDLSGKLLADFDRLSAEGKTVLIFAECGRILGLIAVADRIRDDSAEAIKGLQSLGIETVMITGDNRKSAEYVSGRVGINRVVSEVLPLDKAKVIKELSAGGRAVAMVGDGINDSVALTEADVGIAVGKGADVAIDSADVVLARGGMSGVVAAIKLGRRVLLNVYENLFWAFCYNLVGIPLAAGVFIGAFGWSLKPMFGAAAMSISSFLVVSNALRLNLFDPTRVSKKALKSQKTNADSKETAPVNIKTNINDFETNEEEGDMEMKKTVKLSIEGMMCHHCSGRVKSALEESELVFSADVSHEKGMAKIVLVEGAMVTEENVNALRDIVTAAGYKVL